MTENPHENEDLPPRDEKLSEEVKECGEKGKWSEDQKKRSYYYDDAHGYETYNPDEDESEEEK